MDYSIHGLILESPKNVEKSMPLYRKRSKKGNGAGFSCIALSSRHLKFQFSSLDAFFCRSQIFPILPEMDGL